MPPGCLEGRRPLPPRVRTLHPTCRTRLRRSAYGFRRTGRQRSSAAAERTHILVRRPVRQYATTATRSHGHTSFARQLSMLLAVIASSRYEFSVSSPGVLSPPDDVALTRCPVVGSDESRRTLAPHGDLSCRPKHFWSPRGPRRASSARWGDVPYPACRPHSRRECRSSARRRLIVARQPNTTPTPRPCGVPESVIAVADGPMHFLSCLQQRQRGYQSSTEPGASGFVANADGVGRYTCPHRGR